MLSDGGDEFRGSEDLEVFLVAPMSHGRPVKDFARVLQVGDLLFRKGVSEDIFRHRLLSVAVISGEGENVLGVLNLDMIAWNTPQSSPDIDLIGNTSIPGSMELANLFAAVVATYNLELVPQVRSSKRADSDHYSFWQYGYSAILGIEDEADFNPYYHSSGDLLNRLNADYFTQFVKAAVGTFRSYE